MFGKHTPIPKSPTPEAPAWSWWLSGTFAALVTVGAIVVMATPKAPPAPTYQPVYCPADAQDEAQTLIQANGWRCDVVDSCAASPWSSRTVNVGCNGLYSYSVWDKGGRWQVTVN